MVPRSVLGTIECHRVYASRVVVSGHRGKVPLHPFTYLLPAVCEQFVDELQQAFTYRRECLEARHVGVVQMGIEVVDDRVAFFVLLVRRRVMCGGHRVLFLQYLQELLGQQDGILVQLADVPFRRGAYRPRATWRPVLHSGGELSLDVHATYTRHVIYKYQPCDPRRL